MLRILDGHDYDSDTPFLTTVRRDLKELRDASHSHSVARVMGNQDKKSVFLCGCHHSHIEKKVYLSTRHLLFDL